MPLAALASALRSAAGLAAAAACIAAPAMAQGVFPTETGSRWELADSGGRKIVRTISASRAATGGTAYSVRDRLADGRYRVRWLREDAHDTDASSVLDERGRVVMTLYGDAGRTYTSPATAIGFGYDDGKRMQVAGLRRVVTTPAGRFTGCIEVAYPDSTHTAREWFAPGVGLVKRLEWSVTTGARVYLLRSAAIGGRPVGATPADPVAAARAALARHVDEVLFNPASTEENGLRFRSELLEGRPAAEVARWHDAIVAEARAMTPGQGDWTRETGPSGGPIFIGRLWGLYAEVEILPGGTARTYVEVD